MAAVEARPGHVSVVKRNDGCDSVIVVDDGGGETLEAGAIHSTSFDRHRPVDDEMKLKNHEDKNVDSNSKSSESRVMLDRGVSGHNSWSSIHKCVEESISEKAALKISRLLHEVSQLSDLEKLLLYIKLPTGLPEPPDPLKINHNYPLGNRPHVCQAFTWIKTHLDEDPEVSLPKHEVYDSYRIYCQLHEVRPLSTADFGKAIKQVFPKVKPRRLGTRGNSRYCYSGLCKKKTLLAPTLPNVDEIKNSDHLMIGSCKSELSNYISSPEEEVFEASSQLICEWAEKLFSEGFDSINKLAYYLISKMLVDKRSVAAITLLSLFANNDTETSHEATMLLRDGESNQHRETQLQLQRKIHEKERIKEQKRKIHEQQTAMCKNSLNRSRNKKNTGSKTKDLSNKFRSQSKVNQSDDKALQVVPKKTIQRSHSADDAGITSVNRKLIDADNDRKLEETVACNSGESFASNSRKSSTSQGKQGSDKCMTSIILMPTYPSLQINLPSCKPKYKPIQPKPHAEINKAEPTDNSVSNDALGNASVEASAINNGDVHNRLKRSVAPESFLDADGSKKAHIESCNGVDANDRVDVLNSSTNGTSNRETKIGSVDVSDAQNPQMNKTEQLSQLRWLLQQNLNKGSCKSNGGVVSASNGAKSSNGSESSDVHADCNLASNYITRKPANETDADASTQIGMTHENQVLINKSFQFTPISMRNATPADSLCSTNHSSLTNSPVPSNLNSQQATPNIFGPPSNDSPFVSPLATPLSRSRHNSGQANLRVASSQPNTESSNSSPFLSPHGTPVHVRSRHGSGAQASVRFNVNNNRHTHTLPSVRENSEQMYCRTRNISGNSGASVPPLSPLSKSAPMSPMYSQFSSSQPDLTQDSFTRINQSSFSQSMHHPLLRQLSSSQHLSVMDPSQEVRSLLQNSNPGPEMSGNPRCQSVPLYQMLNYVNNQLVPAVDPGQDTLLFSKSYPATPNENQVFQFPTESDQMESYFQDTPTNYVSYPATPATTPVQVPSYPGTPAAMSYSGTPNNASTSDRFGQSSNMMYDSISDLNQYPEPNQAEITLNEDLQVALDNLKNYSDLSQLEKELENNL